MQIGLTILTPTYNRADLLPRLFESIKRQAMPGARVEWLVIDDGSTDNTPELLASFRAERPELVRYQRVTNGGKHRAINHAAQLAHGEWILFIDSDDLLAPGALENIQEVLVAVHERAAIGMARGLRRFPDAHRGEGRFEVPANPGTHAGWVSAQRGFDTAELLRVKALQAHPFPEHVNERFMAESWLWHELDKTHLVQFVDQVWVECFYQPGGLTARSRSVRARSPLGAMDVYLAMYRSKASWSVRARAAVNWWRYRYHARSAHRPTVVATCVPTSFAPLGWLLYHRDMQQLGELSHLAADRNA